MSKKRNKRPAPRRTEHQDRNTTNPKVVKTTGSRQRPTPQTRKKTKKNTPADMVFGRENYILMIGGLVLIIIGMMLMNGGEMADPNTWDADSIYSFRRITLAPIVILLGLIVEIVAIFRKSKPAETPALTTEG
ncbi:MAG: DUF3098 domain-containing protein [Saprospiraceae bacterium]